MNKVFNIPKYKNLTDLCDNYIGTAAKYIVFENNMYQYIGTEVDKGLRVHNYLCKAEYHSIKIYVKRDGSVLYAPGKYVIS